jgi:hypothetical protein
MTLCSIHQPTFFPWLGYFDKIRRSDVFIFLDRAAWQKSGSSMNSWCNRVKMNVSGLGSWVSLPVVREHGVQPIHTVRIDHARPWRESLRKTIEINYRKSRNFAAVYPFIDSLIAFETDLIADFNMNAITGIAAHLGLSTKYIREIELPETNLLANERLVKLVQMVGATSYLYGAGSAGYMDATAFEAGGIELVPQNFTPEPYGTPEKYIPGLSVIDYLMHRE